MRRLARPSCWPDDFTSRTTSYRLATCLCSGCWAVIRRLWSTWCTLSSSRSPGPEAGPRRSSKLFEAYFAAGAVATETARRLHVSVRTVTYRLAKVKTLTGTDPADPAQRLALHMAVVGARLLDWPASEVPRQMLS